MKVMLDQNVLLDYIQEREPHYYHSAIVVSEVLQGKLAGVIPAHAITTIYYISAKRADRQRANEITDWLLKHFDVAPADKPVFIRARILQLKDYEDAVVESLAEACQCDFLITRNMADFVNSPIAAITPEDFVRLYIALEEANPSSN